MDVLARLLDGGSAALLSVEERRRATMKVGQRRAQQAHRACLTRHVPSWCAMQGLTRAFTQRNLENERAAAGSPEVTGHEAGMPPGSEAPVDPNGGDAVGVDGQRAMSEEDVDTLNTMLTTIAVSGEVSSDVLVNMMGLVKRGDDDVIARLQQQLLQVLNDEQRELLAKYDPLPTPFLPLPVPPFPHAPPHLHRFAGCAW